MARYGPTIGQALGRFNGEYDASRVQLLRFLVADRISNLLTDQPTADPIKIFVKQEPHKQSKLDEERYRLISAVSVVDTMVDRMLFQNMAKKALETLYETPSMVGWTPLMGGYKVLRRLFPGRVACCDKSSWDWTVPEWMVDLWLDFILELSYSSPSYWRRLVRARFKMLFKDAVFKFSDSLCVRQKYPGIMKSGCYLTILLNSVGQVLLHMAVQQRLKRPLADNVPRCMGDDTVQHYFDYVVDYARTIDSLGFRVKEVKVQSWIEFAGFAIDWDFAQPVYWEKHLFSLSHMDYVVLGEALASYQIIYAQEPAMLSVVHALLDRVDPKAKLPVCVLKAFMSGTLKMSNLAVNIPRCIL